MINLNSTSVFLKMDISPEVNDVHYTIYYTVKTNIDFKESGTIGIVQGLNNILLSPNEGESITVKNIYLYNDSADSVSATIYINNVILYKLNIPSYNTYTLWL